MAYSKKDNSYYSSIKGREVIVTQQNIVDIINRKAEYNKKKLTVIGCLFEVIFDNNKLNTSTDIKNIKYSTLEFGTKIKIIN